MMPGLKVEVGRWQQLMLFCAARSEELQGNL